MFRTQYFRKFYSIVINRYSIFLLGIYFYSLAIDYRGGLNSTLFLSQWIELFFLFYFYVYFYFVLKPVRWRSLFAAMPIVASYFLHDLFFLTYGKIFRLINFVEIPELIQVLPLGYGIILAVLIVTPFIVFFSFINYRNQRVILIGALPASMLCVLIIVFPQAFTNFIHAAGNEIIEWSDAESVESNGRYVMLFYREAERRSVLTSTAQYRDRARYENDVAVQVGKLKQNSNHRSVHLIVLESFLDPRLFNKAKFSKNPAHPDFDQFFEGKIGFSISPVFAGATAQAEFELLCGIPALEKLSSMEFNVFTGSPVYCLPGILNKLGYRSVVSNAYKPNYFNSLTAYKGIGFGEIYFPQEYSAERKTYFNLGYASEEYYIFDGTLFDQNLSFVAKSLKENRATPIFNYLMTSYGHWPHDLDPTQRPEVIQVQSDYSDDYLQRSTNQFFYRTKAIAQYVAELIKLDKNSLIILVGDHLPPLGDGPDSYKALQYMDNVENSHYINRLMIVENGSPIVYKDMSHYDLPDVVYNYISGGQYCRQKPCAFLDGNTTKERWSFLEKYLTLMAHASE